MPPRAISFGARSRPPLSRTDFPPAASDWLIQTKRSRLQQEGVRRLRRRSILILRAQPPASLSPRPVSAAPNPYHVVRSRRESLLRLSLASLSPPVRTVR